MSADGAGRPEATDRTVSTEADLDGLDFAKADGLVPVICQAVDNGRVLMMAWADRDALARSLDTGRMHFWSRSRQARWMKGETSGNVLEVVSLHADCDADTVLARVRPTGPACHTGEDTCFGALPGAPRPDPSLGAMLDAVDAVLARRQAERPEGSYTVRLLDDENLRLKKLGEETAELVTALAKAEADRIPEEAADLLYHVLAALRGAGADPADVAAVLASRRG
ncbi:MAG: bifunctional phosphoribosyl-AMP cyclohydrolase/phosphoribosyl-ATP diphosphatase HisIE [Longimicrobiales bacterium]